jgi:hypothetical protein
MASALLSFMMTAFATACHGSLQRKDNTAHHRGESACLMTLPFFLMVVVNDRKLSRFCPETWALDAKHERFPGMCLGKPLHIWLLPSTPCQLAFFGRKAWRTNGRQFLENDGSFKFIPQ